MDIIVVFPQRISFETMKARWAYSELISSRVGADYERSYGIRWPQLFLKATKRVPFCALSEDECQALVIMNAAIRQQVQEQLTPGDYQLAQWTGEDLRCAFALSQLDPLGNGVYRPLLTYAHAVPPTPEFYDPRGALRQVQLDHDVPQNEPGIVASMCFGYVLVEGYLRALLFLRSADPVRRFLVWVPVQNAA